MKDAQASEKEKDQATEKEKEKGAQFTVKAAQATKNTAKGMYVYCSIVLCVYYGICNSCALGNRGQRKRKWRAHQILLLLSMVRKPHTNNGIFT